MTKASLLGAVLALPFLAGTAAYAQEGPPKWSVGAIGFYGTTPFAAEDDEFNAFPYVSYRGDRFFIEGTALGFHLLTPREDADLAFALDVVASARMLPGSSRNKVTADLGLEASLSGSFGDLTLTGLRDVTDTSNGTELRASYGYTFTSDKLFVTPSVGVSWQDKKLTNYLWGTTEEQQARMVEKERDVILPVFQPNTKALNFNAGITAVYQLSDSVTMIGLVNASYLDKDIRLSPAIDKRYMLSVGLGLAYNF